MKPRETAVRSAVNFLRNFQQDRAIWDPVIDFNETNPLFLKKTKDNLEQHFEMMERELSGYLSHPKSIYHNMFVAVSVKLFPGGIIVRQTHGLAEGYDLLISLQETAKKIPQLKNPEFGIRDIIGYNLALQFLLARSDILKKLLELERITQEKNLQFSYEKQAYIPINNQDTPIPETKQKSWTENLAANKEAILNLIAHPIKNQKLNKPASKITQTHEKKPLYPYLRPCEITMARLGFLSFFPPQPYKSCVQVSLSKSKTTTIEFSR